MRRYDTDPSSPARAPLLERPIFDATPERNRDQPQQRFPLTFLPDDLLVATLAAHGQPLWSADQLRTHPGLRFAALRFWCDVQDAAEGDCEAQERVDRCREAWQIMRREELISDVPGRSIGFWER